VCTYLCIGRLRDLLQVILSSSGDSVKEDLLSHSASQHHTHPVKQLLFAVQVLLSGEVLSITKTFPSRDDRHLYTKQSTLIDTKTPESSVYYHCWIVVMLCCDTE